MFKTDKKSFCVNVRTEKDIYCHECRGEKTRCFKMDGRTFISGDKKTRGVIEMVEGEVEIAWIGTQLTSRLNKDDYCPKIIPECSLNFNNLVGMEFRTWKSLDPDRKTVELGRYIP